MIIPLAIWMVAIGTTACGTWYALKQFRTSVVSLSELPPISILKPLKGSDSGLRDNLGSFFHLNYPAYEILFSVESEHDPAYEVVKQLIDRYPAIDAEIIVAKELFGPNPKINNLLTAYERASFDHILISDSNVRVTPDYLRRAVAHMTADVGLVTAVVAGTAPRGMGARLESVYLNSFYARWMHIAAAFGASIVVGKSMLFRRSTLNRFGGIRTLSRYIAEDYMAGQAIRKLGLKVAVQHEPIAQYIGISTLQSFWSRHLRWGRIRKAQAPIAFVVEPLFGAVTSALFGAWAWHKWFDIDIALFVSAHLFIWFFCDFILMRRLEPGVKFGAPFVWLLRELLALPLWCHTAIGNSVKWRGNRLKIMPGGLVAIA